MKLRALQTFSVLAVVFLASAGTLIPLGFVEIPLRSYAPVLFYFSLVLLLLTLTLSRLGIFFAALVRDRVGQTPDKLRYVSGIADRFLWPSAALLLAGGLLFTASFVVQAA